MWCRAVGFIVTLTLSMLAVPLVSDAQTPAEIPSIGVLSLGFSSAAPHIIEAFQQALRKLCWVQGQNIAIEYRFAEGKFERLAPLVAELVQRKVDILVTPGEAVTRVARQATTTIPIVMVAVGDPVASRLVASLARPGGNMTGLSTRTPELSGKNLELLKEVVPEVTRVAVLQNAASPASATLRETEAAAQALGVQLHLVGARDPEEFDSAIAALTRERVGALLVLQDPMFLSHRKRIADLAAKHQLPAMYQRREYVDAGGLIAYGASRLELFRRAATYVDKILKGAKPGELPIEQPTRFELVINLRAAKALGLTIPPTLLFQADEVIQ